MIILTNGPSLTTWTEGVGALGPRTFRLHYGIIGSDGNLDALPEPGIVHESFAMPSGRSSVSLCNGERLTAILVGKTLLRAGGWFYLAMPEECFTYLRERLAAAQHAIAHGTFPALVGRGSPCNWSLLLKPLMICAGSIRLWSGRCAMPPFPNNWLRAVRNICRFRNFALHPDAISDTHRCPLKPSSPVIAILRRLTLELSHGLLTRRGGMGSTRHEGPERRARP